MSWFGAGFSMIMHIAFTILIVMLIIWLFKTLFRSGYHKLPEQNTAIEILKQRYAKGEITSEEFHRMKKDLE